ncbi:DMT family transporter [Novosphingobium mangrovi (ex Hu et al. 2023)]|uniref:Guanidinium exporter n=1 Tax=Novosphingobium mangrovi (ex Hu et al. 2023) TaxID=2930094 RepID=A0ABT0A9A1_9SPHN|nr:multidrug efflux SMR transporter [Novosphingobium mangrovi (ex Hu et al. 2023)]MCJ1959770.1 multidrug efflux SMR transporter [Novosphingobium mangrovi (ex Hu et al. 2023)]
MAWVFVVLAGLLETVWIYFLKNTQEGVTALGALAMAASLLGSFWLLALAMRTIPLAAAYAAWTGIGTLGAFLLGFLVFGERLSPAAIAGLVLIVSGTVLLRVATGSGA